MGSRVQFDDSVFEQVDDPVSFHDEEEKRRSDDVREVKNIAKTETRYITISKICVTLSILIAAALVSAGTYIFLQEEEDNSYSTTYESVYNSVRNGVKFNARNTFLAVRSLSKTLTSEASALEMVWPQVSFPSFETLCDSARKQGGFLTIFFMPLVEEDELDAWNNYSVANQGWIEDSREVALSYGEGGVQREEYVDMPIAEGIFFGIPELGIERAFAPNYGPPPYMPIWMQSPPPIHPVSINFDYFVAIRITIGAMIKAKESVMGEVADLRLLAGPVLKMPVNQSTIPNYADTADSALFNWYERPHSTVYTPIFEVLNDPTSKVVGVTASIISWDRYLFNLMPEGTGNIDCVIKNTCGQQYTYRLNGGTPIYLGEGDMHDTGRDSTEGVFPYYDFLFNETQNISGHCVYSLSLYTTQEFEDDLSSNIALILTIVVSCTFGFMIITFFFYDWLVKKRNMKVMAIANKTSALVSSLFPSNVRDRLLQGEHTENKSVDQTLKNTFMRGKRDTDAGGARTLLKNFLQSEIEHDSLDGTSGENDMNKDPDLNAYGSKPIADIFPETTVFFGDIVGFTAWSSTREPSQVFTLLETIYKAFDDIALRRRVFKVETVGDCYVAVCGLPDPRSDHAVVMARFSRACLLKMHELVHKLEILLGPDTAELDMRIGMHSGPVTAGVLRGERARFQLFGDTMNTASRMESTGFRGKIHISKETADLLTAAGKENWFVKREDMVHAKGKGELQTYWLQAEGDQANRSSSMATGESAVVNLKQRPTVNLDKNERLVKWNCDLLLKLLKEMEAARDVDERKLAGVGKRSSLRRPNNRNGTVLDEVQEIIHLPHLRANRQIRNANQIELPAVVQEQLTSYILSVSMLYHENPFHCFEHASHVTMSVSKLLSRIIAPDLTDEERKKGNMALTLHDHTYGITSDPLTQFACVFSALIHDVDHSGVPNVQLARENPRMAELYGGRSIAEQNSVDLAWNLLMGPEFSDLRSAICKTPDEEERFRQLVVNSVMATDIMDKDLKKLRNERWDRAFSATGDRMEESQKDSDDRKATIVIEHLIQASDVAHTMQHWHIYRKWNQKLYTEMYTAYAHGRADRDPAEFWYTGEIGFFDFYIIPLANKLKDCGVFGVSSDEYLNYAMKNRAEWEQRGREVVAEMVTEMNTLFPNLAKASASSEVGSIPEQAPSKKD